ncbi:MAG TPA: PrsW family glutamic-type intramembrane protease [Stellaceae bacterium]|jgi:RsiW-degrading membrane proteinase PrsW (M82 family)|nr:PrsW family glutamic-type intramembrane protease [Stellaceae bacterium]
MTFQPDDAKDGDISRADLLPFLTSFGELRRRAFLWPGATLAVFTAALLIFAAVKNEAGFFWCLAGLISLGNLFLIYLWCGKKMPFPYMLLIAAAAFGIDAVLSPLIIAAERVMPQVIAPGLIEETVKVLPLIVVLAMGMLLSHPLQREYGLREPLDGIILAAASATGFAFLETMFIYVPKYGELISTPRLLVNLFGHIAYGGTFGYFIGLAALRHRRAMPAALAVAIGFGLANLLHDLWDAMRFYGSGLALVSPIHEVIIAIICFIVLGSLIVKAREVSPEREFLWPFGSLAPYRAPEVDPLPAMPVLPGDIWLATGGRRLSLTETTHLTVRDIPCLAAPAADGIVAEVREHPDNPSLLVLRNLSKNIWEAVLPDGTVRAIEPAGTVRLLAGTRLVFGTQSGVILVTSTEIGADPRAKPEEEWC